MELNVNYAKFYFNSFLISFSAFLGAVVSLLLIAIFQSSLDIVAKIGLSAIIFLGSLFLVLIVLWKVISYLGSVFKQEEW